MSADGKPKPSDRVVDGQESETATKAVATAETDDWVASSLSGTCSCLEVLPIDGGFVIRNGSRARGLRANPLKDTNLEVSDNHWYGFIDRVKLGDTVAPSFRGEISIKASEGLGAQLTTSGGTLVFTWSEWTAFYQGVTRCEFDRIALRV